MSGHVCRASHARLRRRANPSCSAAAALRVMAKVGGSSSGLSAGGKAVSIVTKEMAHLGQRLRRHPHGSLRDLGGLLGARPRPGPDLPGRHPPGPGAAVPLPDPVPRRASLYSKLYGPPMLRARHLPHAVTPRRRDAWLRCMAEALEEIGLPPEGRELLLLRLAPVARHMVNRED